MIIAEDGSTDDTKKILQRLQNELPIRVYMNNKRKARDQYRKAELVLSCPCPYYIELGSKFILSGILWCSSSCQLSNDELEEYSIEDLQSMIYSCYAILCVNE